LIVDYRSDLSRSRKGRRRDNQF